MDRLSFCRKNLNKLNFEELSRVYNFITMKYGDGEQVFENDMTKMWDIVEIMDYFELSAQDWEDAIERGDYNPEDKYVEISMIHGVVSYSDKDIIESFVYKKMNGEAMTMIEEFLESKGITNWKYVVVHDVENEEFHLHRLCEDGNPSRRKEIVGCEDLHEIFVLAEGLNISKNDIVDYRKLSEIKQYS